MRIILATIAVVWRDISLEDLALVFFVLALLDGVVAMAGAVRASCCDTRAFACPRIVRPLKDGAMRHEVESKGFELGIAAAREQRVPRNRALSPRPE